MDIPYEARLDFLLMSLYTGRHMVLQGKERMPIADWNFIFTTTIGEEYRGREIIFFDQLFIDGYILPDPESKYSPTITEAGIKFLINEGGYTKKEKDALTESETKRLNLLQLKRNKWAFIISIIAIVISAASFVIALIAFLHKSQSLLLLKRLQ